MVTKVRKYYFILLFFTLTFSTFLYATTMLTTRLLNEDEINKKDLPAIEINGNYISPNGGIDTTEAKKLIIIELKKDSVKGDINSAIKLREITTKESWENIGVQLYKVNVDYAWINGIAVIKDKEVLTILSGMPTETIFLSDLDNDSIYEIYINILLGSGIISEEILGFNVSSNESYRLSMRMEKDLHLFIENGILMTKIRPFHNNKVKNTSTGKVILKNSDNRSELAIEIKRDIDNK